MGGVEDPFARVLLGRVLDGDREVLLLDDVVDDGLEKWSSAWGLLELDALEGVAPCQDCLVRSSWAEFAETLRVGGAE